jgi:MFS family permease
MEQTQKAISAWAPLQEPVFRALWTANAVSNIGGWMQAVGAAWLMTSLTSSPLMVTMVQFANSVPVVFLALPAGALADIADRRFILLSSQIWMLLASATLACLVFSGAISPMLLLTLTCLLGMGTALMGPASQAIITDLVPSSQLGAAVSLNSAGFNLARALGPALGGIILAKAGAGFTFLVNSISFLAVIIVLYRWRQVKRKAILPAERFFGAMRGGLRYVRYSPALQSVLLRTGCFVICGSALWALLPLVVRTQLALGPAAYGAMLGALGTGALVGAIILPKLRSKLSVEALADCSVALFGAVTIITALLQNFTLLLVVLLMGGMAWMTLLSLFNFSARSVVPAWVQARSLSAYLLVFQGGTAVGSLLWGAVAARIGLRAALIFAGCGLFLNLALVFRYSLGQASAVNVLPALDWPDPPRLDHSYSTLSPTLVRVEYQIQSSRMEDFTAAMHRLERSRRRDGAVYWALFADPSQPGLYLEEFLVESWLEHLRQHERATVDDHDLQETIQAMQIGLDRPVVHHYVAGERP